MDSFAAADRTQVGSGHGECQAALGDRNAGQGHDLDFQATEPDLLIVVQDARHSHRLDRAQRDPSSCRR